MSTGNFHVYVLVEQGADGQPEYQYVESHAAKAEADVMAESIEGIVVQGGTETINMKTGRLSHLGASKISDFRASVVNKSAETPPAAPTETPTTTSDSAADVLADLATPTAPPTEARTSSEPEQASSIIAASTVASKDVTDSAAVIMSGFVQRPDFNQASLSQYVTLALVIAQTLHDSAGKPLDVSAAAMPRRSTAIVAPKGQSASTPGEIAGGKQVRYHHPNGTSIYVDVNSPQGQEALRQQEKKELGRQSLDF
jgi:hypothetical protein